MKGWFSIYKSINIIQNKKTNQGQKSHDHLQRCRKGLRENPASLHDKIAKEVKEVSYFVSKATYNKHTDNNILNWGKLKMFPLKSGTRQGCSLLLLLFNGVLKF
jgi:hypothetical protein